MKHELRFVATVVVISTLSLICVYASASGLDVSPTALAALRVKADQAQPRDRCFLYAKLVSQMTDLAGRYRDAGVDMLIASAFGNDTETLALLASDVIPLSPS